MDVYKTEEETIESIKQWWKENGLAVALGLLIGLGGIYGVRTWIGYQQTQSEEASLVYDQLAKSLAAKQYVDVLKHGDAILNEYDGTPYATLASLAMAKAKLESDDAAGARGNLQWVIDNADDEGMRHIARVRLLRVMLDAKEYDAVLAMLAKQDKSAFSPTYDELRGDVYAAQGKPDQAREVYRLAMAGLPASSQRRELLQMKLDDLAEATASVEPASGTN